MEKLNEPEKSENEDAASPDEDKKRKPRKKAPKEGNDAARSLNKVVLKKFLEKEDFAEVSLMADAERITEVEWTEALGKFKNSVFDLSRDEILRLVSREMPAMNSPFPVAWQGDCIVSPRAKTDRRIAFQGKKYSIQDLFYVGLKSEKEMASRSIDSVVTANCDNKANCVKSDHLEIKPVKAKKGQKREGTGGDEVSILKKSKALIQEADDEIGKKMAGLTAGEESSTAFKSSMNLNASQLNTDDLLNISIPATQDDVPDTQTVSAAEYYKMDFVIEKK